MAPREYIRKSQEKELLNETAFDFSSSDETSLLNLNIDFHHDLDLGLESPASSSYSVAISADNMTTRTSSLPQLRPKIMEKRSEQHFENHRGMTTHDNFESLPIAVRRKYFSTLERLRFAQNPGSFTVSDYFVRPPSSTRRRHSIGTDRRRPQFAPSSTTSGTPPNFRRPSRQSSVSSADVSWFLNLPDKIRKKQFSKEEQSLYGVRNKHREIVILDAADEAVYKASRRASRNLTPTLMSSTSKTFPTRERMDVARNDATAERPTSITKALMESFRWMDEETNLDLRLALDDYHANLDGVVIPSPSATQRPSFRRHMSISKVPFGRTSTSSFRSPQTPRSPTSPSMKPHSRQLSRTLSIIQPRHGQSDSVTSIDPHATHYQDPETRLKLRVYLASPSKFDEAIEFGFPSLEGVTDADKENAVSQKSSKHTKPYQLPKSPLIEHDKQTFLHDDRFSLSEDEASIMEPESPLTPTEADGTFNKPTTLRPTASSRGPSSDDFAHLGFRRPVLQKQQESYTQALAGSREMTLRMTLTRPDLRADDTMLYGWQAASKNSADEGSAETAQTAEKFPQGPFGGADGWGPPEKDNGVVRRLWNRVKSQRKSS